MLFNLWSERFINTTVESVFLFLAGGGGGGVNDYETINPFVRNLPSFPVP